MKLGLMVTQQYNYACRHCMIESVQTHFIVSDEVFERERLSSGGVHRWQYKR